jgi:hypothetical protein
LSNEEILVKLIENAKQESSIGYAILTQSVETEILYDFMDFYEKLKRHLSTVIPMRSMKRKEELLNAFYH